MSANNTNTIPATMDAALLVPDALSVPTPLRAESLRQLEEVGPYPTQPQAAAARSTTPASELSPPPTATDEEEEDGASLASASDSDDGLEGSSTGSVVHTGPEGSAGLHARLAPPAEGGKKVLVTGGAGFVGSHVADFLLTRGDAVIIVDEFNDYYDTTLKRANVAYLLEKHGAERLRIVEVRSLGGVGWDGGDLLLKLGGRCHVTSSNRTDR